MNTTHFSESEFIDLIEDRGALDPGRAAHLDACASCRQQAATLGAVLRATATVDVPEPSPLFWQHFAARVHEQVSAEPVTGRSAWSWVGVRGLLPLTAAAALVIAVFSGVLLLRAGRDAAVPVEQAAVTVPSAPAAAASTAADRLAATPDVENAEVWAVLTAAASTVQLEDAHAAGMHVHPATIERAVQNLSTEEMTELARLLQSELKRSSN